MGWQRVGHNWVSNTLGVTVAQMVKNLLAIQETRVQSLNWEDPLEKGGATHSGILAWRIPWTEDPGGLQSLGSQRVRHNWMTNTFNTYYIAQNISRFYRIKLEWISGYYKKVVFLMNKSNYLALPTLILLTGLNYIKWENQLTHYVNANRLKPKVQQCCNRDISVPV